MCNCSVSVSMDMFTYAAGPSCFIIFKAQSIVLLYLCASRPCREMFNYTPRHQHHTMDHFTCSPVLNDLKRKH